MISSYPISDDMIGDDMSDENALYTLHTQNCAISFTQRSGTDDRFETHRRQDQYEVPIRVFKRDQVQVPGPKWQMRKSVIRSKGKAEAILERDCRSTASMPERAVRPGDALFVKDNAAPPSSCAFSCFETPTAIVCGIGWIPESEKGPELRNLVLRTESFQNRSTARRA